MHEYVCVYVHPLVGVCVHVCAGGCICTFAVTSIEVSESDISMYSCIYRC